MKFKRILCLILAFLMLASMVACGNTNEPAETNPPETEAPETDAPETDDGKIAAPKYDGVFKTGYARVAITPAAAQLPMGDFSKVDNDVYATCVAVNDGDKTLILVSIDQKSISESHCDSIKSRISNVTKVPTDNIYISATHNHSIEPFSASGVWAMQAFGKIATAAKDAIADLSDTEMFIGRGNSKGMAFVRRYVDANGAMSSVNPAENAIKSVRDPDEEIQVVRFSRKDKKDIIMTNWQAHLAHAVNESWDGISADMAHYIRRDIEAGDDDTLVVYFAGASANINLTAPTSSLQKYIDYVAVARAFASKVLNVIKAENLTRVEAGKITITKETCVAEHKKDSAAAIAAAQARLDSDHLNDRSVLDIAGDKYLVARNKSASRNLRIAAISFGDLAFITVPYEMYDNNGVEVKNGSPFKMTFILTNADGDYAYMPAYEACGEGGYGGYETKATYFAVGVAEKLVAAYVKMLNEHKGIT